MATTFGQFLRERRGRIGVGLREFCADIKLDPSSYSKYERDILSPPGHDVLKRIARGLKIPVAGPEWREMTDLASAGRGELPADLMRDERLVAALPAFYQHLRNHDLPEDQDPTDVLVRALKKVL